MQEKNEPLLKAENGIPIGQLQARLEMIASGPYCCSFLDDWYKDIVGVNSALYIK